MDSSPGEVTALLAQLRDGQQDVATKLVPLVYAELRRLAAHYMRGENPGHTLQATALVHEAYLRLTGGANSWQNRAHFFGVAAHVMRRILVDHARTRNAAKRGGMRRKVPLEDVALFSEEQSYDLLDLDAALERLALRDPRQSRIVELRYFAGLNVDDTAEVLGISAKTVKRDWSVARAWLHGEISKDNRSEARSMGTH